MEVIQALGKFREVFLVVKDTKKHCLSQLGTEEEPIEIYEYIRVYNRKQQKHSVFKAKL